MSCLLVFGMLYQSFILYKWDKMLTDEPEATGAMLVV